MPRRRKPLSGSDKTGSTTTVRADDAGIVAASPPPAGQKREKKTGSAEFLGGGRGLVWPFLQQTTQATKTLPGHFQTVGSPRRPSWASQVTFASFQCFSCNIEVAPHTPQVLGGARSPGPRPWTLDPGPWPLDPGPMAFRLSLQKT